jgi:hypothetical protein
MRSDVVYEGREPIGTVGAPFQVQSESEEHLTIVEVTVQLAELAYRLVEVFAISTQASWPLAGEFTHGPRIFIKSIALLIYVVIEKDAPPHQDDIADIRLLQTFRGPRAIARRSPEADARVCGGTGLSAVSPIDIGIIDHNCRRRVLPAIKYT